MLVIFIFCKIIPEKRAEKRGKCETDAARNVCARKHICAETRARRNARASECVSHSPRCPQPSFWKWNGFGSTVWVLVQVLVLSTITVFVCTYHHCCMLAIPTPKLQILPTNAKRISCFSIIWLPNWFNFDGNENTLLPPTDIRAFKISGFQIDSLPSRCQGLFTRQHFHPLMLRSRQRKGAKDHTQQEKMLRLNLSLTQLRNKEKIFFHV